MRKFLSSTEGATFNQEMPGETICVRKDCVEVPSKVAILECITPEMFSKGRLLANKCLKMYPELLKNPPFPAWKDGLDEVWN